MLFLAGPSCCGKTTLGLALIDRLGDWLFWEVDRAQPRIPTSAVLEPDQVARLSDDARSAVLAAEWRMVEGNVGALSSYVRAGANVVAEIFLWDEQRLAIASRVLSGLAPLVVELRCPVSVLEEREARRRSTYLGVAREQAEAAWVVPAGLVVDATRSTQELVDLVASWLAGDAISIWRSSPLTD